jgi:hypothetical protein
MITTYKTADRAILVSMENGQTSLCLPTQANVDQLQHECDRWQDDGRFIRFISDIHGWSIVVVKTDAFTIH